MSRDYVSSLPFIPTADELEAEVDRIKYRSRYYFMLRSTIYILVVVAAAAALVATFWMPVLRIHGTSMSPTLSEGEIVVAMKNPDIEPGDLVAFYYGNKLLVKRCIAGPGQWVDIDEAGNIYVDGALLDEPYLAEKALGDCDIELPYQVPGEQWFLVGDHRATSVDSRSTVIGCVAEEQIVGKLACRVWPLNNIGLLD